MAMNVRPRTKDHWTVPLRIRRPGGASGPTLATLILVLVQAVLLFLTASSFAKGGGIYGCGGTPCQVTVDHPAPALATAFGIAIFVLPVVLGVLARGWSEAVALAVIPWGVVLVLTSNKLLTPAAADLSVPFWLDPARLTLLIFSLAWFALLGWLGWVIRQAAKTK
jgi:hypothetical protein